MEISLDLFVDSGKSFGEKNMLPVLVLKPEYEAEVISAVFRDQEMKAAFEGKPLSDQVALTALKTEELRNGDSCSEYLTREEMEEKWGELFGIQYAEGLLTAESGLYLGVAVGGVAVLIGKNALYDTVLKTGDDNNGAGYKEGRRYDATVKASLFYSPKIWDGTVIYKNTYSCDIEEAVIPEGVVKIGKSAFEFFGKLKRVKLPSTLTEIGTEAFGRCTALEEIVIPESVKSIGYAAFSGCKSLKTLKLPDGLTNLGARAFCACESLTEISVPKGIIQIPDSLFILCTSLKKVVLPEGLNAINNYAFGECESLSEITIPPSVTYIGSWAFERCRSLKRVNMSDTLKFVGTDAFPWHKIEGLKLPPKK